MQMQMRDSAELTGPTILGQPALLSAVPGVRPFLFIGKFFRQHPLLLLTQTMLTLSCGCSWLTTFPLYTTLQPLLISLLSLQLHAPISVALLLVSMPLLSLVFSCIWLNNAVLLFMLSTFLPTALCGMSFQKHLSRYRNKECCHSRYAVQTSQT